MEYCDNGTGVSFFSAFFFFLGCGWYGNGGGINGICLMWFMLEMQ